MKITHKLVALFSVSGLSSAVAAQPAASSALAFLNVEAGISLFATVLALAVFGADYLRRPAIDLIRARPRLQPASEAFRGHAISRVRCTERHGRRHRRAAACV